MLDVKQCLVDDSQGKPDWCANTPYGTAAGSLRCEIDKFGELKGLVAGTTSIVGLPGTSAACFGSLARSIDVAQNGLGADAIQTSATVSAVETASTACARTSRAARPTRTSIHVGEGDDAQALGRVRDARHGDDAGDCLYAPQTAITHGVAFTATEFATMARGRHEARSGRRSRTSRSTARPPTSRRALAAGVTVALAPDWSMGGSQNLLDELRFADAWDNAHWNDLLAPKDLVAMATTHAAQVLGLDDRSASSRRATSPISPCTRATRASRTTRSSPRTPQDVRLVMVGGACSTATPRSRSPRRRSPAARRSTSAARRSSCASRRPTRRTSSNQTYAQITAALEQGLADADAQTPTTASRSRR